jgi:lipopolysaccharide export system protein LptA
MPIPISRLRIWFAIAAFLMMAIVAGAYFYAKWRVENALKEVPHKIGIDIKQSAEGFTISKSEGSHTLFKIQASKAVRFKTSGIAELHNVNIIVYGEDASRFDQIYGDDFEYDPQTGNVTAKGEVQIDLEANPAGLVSPDQSIPQELKNPIHLKTSGLVFNQKTGNGQTTQKVEFQTPEASGSAVGATYVAKGGVLTLESQVQITADDAARQVKIIANRAVIAKRSRTVVLEQAHLMRPGQTADADKAIIFLTPKNTVDHIIASGNIHAEDQSRQFARASADQLELQLNKAGKGIHHAVLTGNVQFESAQEHQQEQKVQITAGRAMLAFSGKNVLSIVHAENGVTLRQQQQPSQRKAPQDVELDAPAVDFFLSSRRALKRVETQGPPQIVIREARAKAPNSVAQETRITAGRFRAEFDENGQMTLLHGEPSARIVASSPGKPDRISTSDTLDVNFKPHVGIESLVQAGNLIYTDDTQKAWADRGRYTTADQMLVLTGSPRIASDAMSASAQTIQLNRETGDAVAEDDVKTTYTNMKAQENGALLASASPIHVTAQKMTAHKSPSIAFFTGDARLWQEANVVQASSIRFDRNRRSVLASGSQAAPVSTVLMQRSRSGKVTPVTITSNKLEYVDSERQIHFENDVAATGSDLTMTANNMNVYLAPKNQKSDQKQDADDASGRSRIEQIVASGNVEVREADRRATGGQLVYTAVDEKFVLSGNSPSIFSAEHGKITGVSLTFFRRDDRVLVEGSTQFPAVTHTQVAH